MKIAIGSDHAGFDLKNILIKQLEDKGFEIKDFGCYSNESMDYPDSAHPVCDSIENKESDLGLLICGSGNGITMTANKHQGIRAALSWTPEIASLARQHNNANVLSLPARFITEDLATEITNAFFDAEFEGGRHQKRVDKIACR
jgi:ribose 5-phosphate isomerase B